MANETPKSYCDAVKELKTILPKRSNEIATDSGIDMKSLEKLIDERVAVTVDAKFENHIKSKFKEINQNSSNEFTQVIYTKQAETDVSRAAPTTISDIRKLNVIIHGLKEDGASSQSNPVKELFETLEVNLCSTSSIDRLGAKSTDKIRPIRITLESCKIKQEFMSSLWKLKHGPENFRKISITEDYTQEERREIKRWADEAKERTKHEVGYEWKVRGTPRTKLRLVKMRTWRNQK